MRDLERQLLAAQLTQSAMSYDRTYHLLYSEAYNHGVRGKAEIQKYINDHWPEDQ